MLCRVGDYRNEGGRGLPRTGGHPSFAPGQDSGRRGVGGVYWTMSAILVVLWAVGLLTGSTEGQWVHLLLFFSLVTFILALAQRGRGSLAS